MLFNRVNLPRLLVGVALATALAAQASGGPGSTPRADAAGLVKDSLLARYPRVARGASANPSPGRPAVGITFGGVQQTSRLTKFAHKVGRFPQIVMWYQDFTSNPIRPHYLDAVRTRGGMPMITWEPDNHVYELRPQPKYKLTNIIAGRFDRYIRSVAVAAAKYRFRFMIRLGEEMNGGWYPWGVGVDGNTPHQFVLAWRHIVSIFRSEGATNVIWVWSPNIYPGGEPFARFYPGDNWVDWVALDGYNDGDPWEGPVATFGPSYEVLSQLTHKPIMIAETASASIPGYKSKARWIDRLFNWALPVDMPLIRAVVWFDMDRGRADWRLGTSPEALAAFGMALRRGGPLP